MGINLFSQGDILNNGVSHFAFSQFAFNIFSCFWSHNFQLTSGGKEIEDHTLIWQLNMKFYGNKQKRELHVLFELLSPIAFVG